jgi:hypothetical protein
MQNAMDSFDHMGFQQVIPPVLNKINRHILAFQQNTSELCKTNQPSDTASLHQEAGEAVDSITKNQTQ